MRRLILRWLINGVALWAAAELVPGIHLRGDWQVIALMALIFGLVNALIGPLLKLLTCPLIVLSLGLFTFVINALLLQFSAWLGQRLGLGFFIENFFSALLGALVISVVSLLLSLLVKESEE